MRNRLSVEEISEIFRVFLKDRENFGEEDTAFIFYDLDLIGEKLAELARLFPSGTLHAVAVKANPLKKILEFLTSLGAGHEAASLPELHMALGSGADPGRIVFDSPVKTKSEIEFALKKNIHINADSFGEIERIGKQSSVIGTPASVGIRVNPQTGDGEILSTSVSGRYSKFGIPLSGYRDELIKTFKKYEWVNGVHVHTGSQGCSLDHLVSGVRRVLDLALEINNKRSGQVRVFDIGGGLPVQYKKDDPPVTMERYREELGRQCPELFSGQFRLITEFGRYTHANAGWAASRIEYVKDHGEKTLMIHLGADMFLRKCYNPDDWHHDVFLTRPDGTPKETTHQLRYHIAGPLCFSGDMIGKNVRLPEAEEGDYLVIRDTGAYTLSMWSRYNSRQVPRVTGYMGIPPEFILIKERESINEVALLWE